MSDSGDSDHIGYLAAQSSDDDSELEKSSNDDDDDGVDIDDEDESDSASDGPSESNGFFDLEAADSDDETSGSGESGTDQDHDELVDNHFFPQFKRLPFELRYAIWEFFCPDLMGGPRVLWFNLTQHRRRDGSERIVPVEGPFLDQQTRVARVMLAIHRESRQLIQKVFPDSLSFGGKAVVRFNAERDIVQLGSMHSSCSAALDLDGPPQLPGFGEHIRHLAVDPALNSATLSLMGLRAPGPAKAYENLRAVYYLTYPVDHKARHIDWCFSDLAKRYVIDTVEEQPGIGEDGQHVYCWPDLEKPDAADEGYVPLETLMDELVGTGLPAHIKAANFNGAPIWPIVTFLWDAYRDPSRRVKHLRTGDAREGSTGESSGSEHSYEEEPNEYESEGIDDSIIEDDSEGSDDEQIVIAMDGDDSDQSEQDDDGSSVSGSPGPGRYLQDGTIDLTGDDDEDMARFSSPEPSSETLRASDDSTHESDSDQPAVRTSRLKRPRARVVDSDSDDDAEDDPQSGRPRKRTRVDNRRHAIVVSSDDEEDERRVMRANRRARAVISEDEDGQDDEQGEDDERGNSSAEEVRGRGNARPGISSSEEEDEEDEESDGGAAVGKSLSLAEKLQLHRENNPIPASESDESGIEGMGGDDYDARDYADFEDDEEGHGIAEEGDEDDQYGVMEDEFDSEDDGY